MDLNSYYASVRDQKFTPDTGGYLADYYSEVMKGYQDKISKANTEAEQAQRTYDEIIKTAQDSMKTRDQYISDMKAGTVARNTSPLNYAAKNNSFIYNGHRYLYQNILDQTGNPLDQATIVKRNGWFSRHDQKMYRNELANSTMTVMNHPTSLADMQSQYDTSKVAYDSHMAEVEATNQKRKAGFLKNQQDILAAGKATAYQQATYVEKPK
jgi:hypothetical protein